MTHQESADLTFLALTVWREARGESPEGKTGVAHCVMNRVKNPAWWGNDIMAVVFLAWQFSSLTDPHDPQLSKWPRRKDRSWAESLEVAAGVIAGTLKHPAPDADSYYDISIPAPRWATKETFVKQIGKLRFHNTVKGKPEAESNGE